MRINKQEINSFPELIDFQESLSGGENKWIFRGEEFNGKIEDSLKTSLEKAFGSITPSLTRVEINKHKINAEKDVIREFQRKLHLYSDNLPTRADIIQWLSIMQHHGAPTRLLDWTYSFWVAIHFAVSRCKPGENSTVAVWAVNGTKSVKKGEDYKKDNKVELIAKEIIKKHNLPYCDHDAIWDNAVVHRLIRAPEPMVYVSSSFRRNERLTLQQGTFMITGDITKSFWENLEKTITLNDGNHIRLGVVKVTHELKGKINKKLLEMNINNAVLFPGIDGFSQSLCTRVPLLMEEKLFLKSKNLILYP